jgi:hypothetical protein
MVKPLGRHWRLLFRVSGAILVLGGLFVAYWWFYKLAPCRRIWDAQWRLTHSESEYWHEVQTAIHRGMWSHDDGFTVGMYGDKAWAQWIMAHVTPGTGIGCLGGGPCHSDYAMRLITNQDVGDKTDAWLDWWKKNESKSQEEWIADGFSRHGVKVAAPPTAAQTEALLAILGNSEGKQGTTIPGYLQYNAFRWLRDSGFEPVGFAVSNRPLPAAVARGLLEYAKFQRRWPSALGLGVLSFGNTPYDRASYPMPRWMKAEFQAMIYALIFGPLVLGVGLIVCSWRRVAGP